MHGETCRYVATPISSPDFVKLADAFGLWAARVNTRAMAAAEAVGTARTRRGALLVFQVEQEDSVYPMVPTGAAVHQMVERPSPIAETAAIETALRRPQRERRERTLQAAQREYRPRVADTGDRVELLAQEALV